MTERGTSKSPGAWVLCARVPTGPVQFAQHEFNGLVNDLEDAAFVGLLGCDGFAFFRAEEMQAMDLDVVEEPAWVLAEKQDGRIGQFAVPQELEVLQHRLGRA